MRRPSVGILTAALAACLGATPAARAHLVPEEAPELPVLSREVPRGSGATIPDAATHRTAKTVDGEIADWTGEPAWFGGVALYSHGEYIYQDHLFDAYGADDGNDVERLALLSPVTDEEPRAYRLDPTIQYAQGELDLPAVGPFTGDEKYGDGPRQDAADLAEVRVAADATNVYLLARTTAMTNATDVAILVLADTAPVDPVYTVPFGSGLSTTLADVAILVANGTCQVADLASGAISSPAGCVTVTNASGFTNAIEAAIPRALLDGGDGKLRLALASGKHDGAGGLADLGVGAAVANVAFRFAEPVRIHFEMRQALALYGGSMDDFFTEIDTAKLDAGTIEHYVPGPGYHDRLFLSDPAISVEQHRSGQGQGIFQHYGVYLPRSYDTANPAPAPLQLWLHFRGGLAHTVGAVVPRVFEDYGEDRGTIVISPSGRGSNRWYVGKAHTDFLEVWDDVHATFAIDADRVYVSGHSMGGWGTYLLTTLYPDRFAAGMPVAGPVTQGAWTGVDFDGCDELTFDDGGDVYTPCYIAQNGGRGRDQHTRRLLENLRHVPLAIFHGAIDELVPVAGVTRQAEQLQLLGYPYRYYLFPTYEHYSHPAVDEWEAGVAYLHSKTRDPNPGRVTYRRDMPFERAVEEVQSDGVALAFDFDSAYWMSELTPADPVNGVARFDGRSLREYDLASVLVPEAGGPASPGQTGPYVMVGGRRVPTTIELLNGFEIALEGASRVRLDLDRMAIDAAAGVYGEIDTTEPLTLRLDGGWAVLPTVLSNPPGVPATLSGGVLELSLAAGRTVVYLVP